MASGFRFTKRNKMSLEIFLSPSNVLQSLALALSIFNLTAFLWLACTVWLNGDRRAGIVRLGVVGLGLSACFFFIHAILISSPLGPSTSFISLDFWWRLIWLPAVGVPYIWFAIGLHYAALINVGWKKRRPFLLATGGVLVLIVLLLLIINRDTFTYIDALRLLSYSNGLRDLKPPAILIPILFLIYVTFCAISPWFTAGRVSRLCKILWHAPFAARRRNLEGRKISLRRALMDAFWDDPVDVEMLEEPWLSWHLARPGLLLAALLMVSLTTTLGVLVVQSMLNWFGYGGAPFPNTFPSTSPLPGSTVPFNLLILDLLANVSVSLVILLIGYSIVRHGVLIARPLARRGFFEQWRGIVIVATLVAILISLLVHLTESGLGGLLLITCLATVAYALFTWSSYTAHDRYIALLGPFVRSTSQRHWLNTDQQKTEQELEHLFFHLCHDILVVQCAYLSVMAGALSRSLIYRWPSELVPGPTWSIPPKSVGSEFFHVLGGGKSSAQVNPARRIQVYVNELPMIIWILPIYNERGLIATLYLGPREDGGAFTEEDMNLAHACAQRILDTLGDHESMQAVAGLLRRRIVDVKLLGAQQRRVLHDEILPQMHQALLQLELVRPALEQANSQEPCSQDNPFAGETTLVQESENGRGIGQPARSPNVNKKVFDDTIELISDTHRRLAAMMRTTSTGAPHRLERNGLIHAITAMLEQDFQHSFDEIDWRVDEETISYIDEAISPAIAELIFAAIQEALRNAARHARGSDIHRRLRLTLITTWKISHFEVLIADNGVGITSDSNSTRGTGGGLLTHSALLAIAGGSLTIKSTPGEGVEVRIVLPTEVLQ